METSETNPVIIVTVGQRFDLLLESMSGSTGYSWCLASLPPGIVLISVDSKPISPGIAPVRQTFTFGATAPLKGGKAEFDLLCLFDLSRESADHMVYTVIVHAKNENDPLKQEIGGQKFLKAGGFMVHSRPIQPYGFANPDKAHLLYGFPPPEQGNLNVIESSTRCILKYGNPFGVSTDEGDCNVKYGYPLLKYGYPPIYKYGFPVSKASGKPISIKDNPAQCVVKYGTPFGVAATADECILKYGFPVEN